MVASMVFFQSYFADQVSRCKPLQSKHLKEIWVVPEESCVALPEKKPLKGRLSSVLRLGTSNKKKRIFLIFPS